MAFKNNFKELANPYEKRLFFQDEMRSGNRTELKRRWTPRRHRPVTPVKIGYDFVYLYAALNPYDGELIALLLPNMTNECFECFMDFFEQQTRIKYGELPILLIADGASNHQARLIHAPNIHLQKLPRACPELNPAERFFEQLRTELSNQILNTIEQVEELLCKILQKYYEQPKLIKSLTLFPYIRH